MSDISLEMLSSDLDGFGDIMYLDSAEAVKYCSSCYDVITDQFFLQAGQNSWHEECLRCCVCSISLGDHNSCFVKEDNIFCRRDFLNTFQTKCSSCCLPIESGDWVRSAGEHVYHLACFSCNTCQRQLSTGEDFAIHDGRVLCRVHALNPDTENQNKRNRAKRFRTAFSDDQIAILQKYFHLDINPTGSHLDHIAKESGLNRRVAQVWFQNARAKLKRTL